MLSTTRRMVAHRTITFKPMKLVSCIYLFGTAPNLFSTGQNTLTFSSLSNTMTFPVYTSYVHSGFFFSFFMVTLPSLHLINQNSLPQAPISTIPKVNFSSLTYLWIQLEIQQFNSPDGIPPVVNISLLASWFSQGFYMCCYILYPTSFVLPAEPGMSEIRTRPSILIILSRK